jgi:hypothetical protein
MICGRLDFVDCRGRGGEGSYFFVDYGLVAKVAF